VLAFWFDQKCMFIARTSQKSIFHSCEAHIPARLDVMDST
jgi:hypothetical protein